MQFQTCLDNPVLKVPSVVRGLWNMVESSSRRYGGGDRDADGGGGGDCNRNFFFCVSVK